MLGAVLTCYKYDDKSTATKVADVLLTPARRALGYDMVSYNPADTLFVPTKEKTASVFKRIILAVLALLMLPVTIIAAIVKKLDSKNSKIHQLHTKSSIGSDEEKSQEVKPRGDGNKPSNECAMCQDNIEDVSEKFFTECVHGPYHNDCIESWYQTCRTGGREPTCPECRLVQSSA